MSWIQWIATEPAFSFISILSFSLCVLLEFLQARLLRSSDLPLSDRNVVTTMGKGRLLVIVVMLLAVLRATDGMVVSILNDMPGPIAAHCHSKLEGDLGLRLLGVGKSYDFTVPGKGFVSGRRYWCTFEATGKPSTTLDVFVGWGGNKNSPCGCTGDVCQWFVNNNYGFACSNFGYTHPWGN